MAEEKSGVPVGQKTAAPPTAGGPDLFTSLHREADRLFREFSQGWPGGLFDLGRTLPTERATDTGSVWAGGVPAVDLVDLEDKIEVRAELPGIAQNDIDLELGDGTLSIRAEKREEMQEGEKESRYYMSERRYGSIARTLRLPDGIDQQKAEAAFENGLLTVTIPKTEEARRKPRKIAIGGG